MKPAPQGRALAVLALGALGVVYGDIGTSPLYALKECFNGPHGLALTQANVDVAEFSVGTPSLDEVFLALTGHSVSASNQQLIAHS